MKLTGNTIFIPGATSGIGLGLALRLQAGNTVIIGGRRTDRLEQITTDNPGIGAVTIDTSDPESIEAAYAKVAAEHPDLNVLIPMAGMMEQEDLHTPDYLPTAENTVITNLLGPIRLIAAFTPLLSQQETATIMTVTSGLAYVPLPISPTYNATKAAIRSFTDSLRVQLADTSIQVVELVPPGVRTDMFGGVLNATNMPLEDFLDEVMTLLETEPEAEQILVENVKYLRFAEANGVYPDALAMLGNVTVD
ncbi:MAG: SDR family NAD(P)-dependent oxidoreductase [Nocardioidaceae bacterium]|nr:MAG: SDR family NAD(P)-dependent oxidoreductase [Nocardioidaceae bacterium]